MSRIRIFSLMCFFTARCLSLDKFSKTCYHRIETSQKATNVYMSLPMILA